MLKNRIKKLEEYLNPEGTDVIIVFTDKRGSLVTKVNGTQVNKLYSNIQQVTAHYKNSNSFIINVSGFGDSDLGVITDKIQTIQLHKDEQFDYNEMLDLVKQKAREIDNL